MTHAFTAFPSKIEVSTGSTDGSIAYCITLHCDTVTVSDLDDYAAKVFGDPTRLPAGGPIAYTLDGEPAYSYVLVNFDAVDAPADRYLLTIHDGRPLFFHLFGGEDGFAELAALIDGFHFVAVTSRTFLDEGFSIGVSALATVRHQATGTIAMSDWIGRGVRITIRAGSPDGRIAGCPWGNQSASADGCRNRYATLNALAHAGTPAGAGLVDTLDVDGEEALLYRIFSFDGDLFNVFVMHAGRPYVISAFALRTSGDSQGNDLVAYLRETLARLDFTD